jgi:ubiquinone/menaquinone biosynthesis C-methylase UbiE
MEIVAYIILAVVCTIGLVFAFWHIGSRQFELPCPVWLRWMVELENPFTKTCRAQTIIEHLGLEPGMAVLDAGCGPGRLTIPIARQVGEHGRVVAMDMQEGMLARTKQRALAESLLNIDYLHAGLGQGALGSNRFDAAVLVTVLGEIPDRIKALKELHEALKPGGMLSVTETVFDPHFQSRGTVYRLAGEAGLVPTESFGSRMSFTMHFKKPYPEEERHVSNHHSA